jgi:hypothetical protein
LSIRSKFGHCELNDPPRPTVSSGESPPYGFLKPYFDSQVCTLLQPAAQSVITIKRSWGAAPDPSTTRTRALALLRRATPPAASTWFSRWNLSDATENPEAD